MFSHVTVGTTDLVRARTFYDAVMGTLGINLVMEIEGSAFAFGEMSGAAFFVGYPFDEQPAERGNGWHCAFNAADRPSVDAFHAAALANGGSDEGVPGLRPHYHANYYAAYVRDPDGNKIQAVCHLPA